jgi:hypothetical protein
MPFSDFQKGWLEAHDVLATEKLPTRAQPATGDQAL